MLLLVKLQASFKTVQMIPNRAKGLISVKLQKSAKHLNPSPSLGNRIKFQFFWQYLENVTKAPQRASITFSVAITRSKLTKESREQSVKLCSKLTIKRPKRRL